LKQALHALMAPLARLCLARGLSFGDAQELLKRAYVDAAREAQEGAPGQRDISRVSAATGLTRREVTRISSDLEVPAAEVIHHQQGARRSDRSARWARWVRSGRGVP